VAYFAEDNQQGFPLLSDKSAFQILDSHP